MKFTTFLITLLLSAACYASGKLSVQGNWYDDGKEVRPMVGFNVYEKLAKRLAVNSWVGYGNQFLETHQDVNWFVAKAQLDMSMKRVTVSPGISYKALPDDNFHDVIPYLKLDLQLW